MILDQIVERRLDGPVSPVAIGGRRPVDYANRDPPVMCRLPDNRFRQVDGIRDGRSVQVKRERVAVVVESRTCDGNGEAGP